MWLMTQHGFYSIVCKGDDAFHIRARVKRDLEYLNEIMGWKLKIHSSSDTDYRYRIIVSRICMLEVLQAIGERIDYGNFKNRVHSTPDQAAKSTAYANVWAELYRLQKD